MMKRQVYRSKPRDVNKFIVYGIPKYQSGVLYAGHPTLVNRKEEHLIVQGRKDTMSMVVGVCFRDEQGEVGWHGIWVILKNGFEKDINEVFYEKLQELRGIVKWDDVLCQFYFAGRNNGEDIEEEFIDKALIELGVYRNLINLREDGLPMEKEKEKCTMLSDE